MKVYHVSYWIAPKEADAEMSNRESLFLLEQGTGFYAGCTRVKSDMTRELVSIKNKAHIAQTVDPAEAIRSYISKHMTMIGWEWDVNWIQEVAV